MRTHTFDDSFGEKLHRWQASNLDPIYQVCCLIQTGSDIEEEQLLACAKELEECLDTAISRQYRLNQLHEVVFLLYEIEQKLYPIYFHCPNSRNLWQKESEKLNNIVIRCKEGRIQSENQYTCAPCEVMMLLGLAENPPSVNMGGLLPFPGWKMLQQDETRMIVYGLSGGKATARLTIQLR